jgi:hypothetical protein
MEFEVLEQGGDKKKAIARSRDPYHLVSFNVELILYSQEKSW